MIKVSTVASGWAEKKHEETFWSNRNILDVDRVVSKSLKLTLKNLCILLCTHYTFNKIKIAVAFWYFEGLVNDL